MSLFFFLLLVNVGLFLLFVFCILLFLFGFVLIIMGVFLFVNGIKVFVYGWLGWGKMWLCGIVLWFIIILVEVGLLFLSDKLDIFVFEINMVDDFNCLYDWFSGFVGVIYFIVCFDSFFEIGEKVLINVKVGIKDGW